MHTFGEASGQHLHPQKTHLLPVGITPDSPLPPTAGGLKIVDSATTLGIHISAGTTVASPDWENLTQKVKGSFSRIAGMGLSAFGRGMASASYGISKFLYHAEFGGSPPATYISQLNSWSSALVERSLPPNSQKRRFAGVPGDMLYGHPKTGGFGALPWQQHITARHAAWGIRLATGDGTSPWECVAKELLQRAHHHLTPFAILGWPAGAPEISSLPPPLQRIIAAVHGLPQLRDIGTCSLPIGSWCGDIPLWGNPLFPNLHLDFGWLVDTPISTLRSLLLALKATCCPPSLWLERRQQFFGCHPTIAYLPQGYARNQILEMLERVPRAWVEAVRPSDKVGSSQESLSLLLSKLGWVLRDKEIPVLEYRVKVGTALALQYLGQPQRRQSYFYTFCRAALPSNSPADEIDKSVGKLPALLRELWKVGGSNDRKETFWRLIYDGLPSSARMHSACVCACGFLSPGRDHHFWECEIAQSLVQTMSSPFTPGEISKASLWLVREPQGCIPLVWKHVCICAIAAMEKARKQMWVRMENRSVASAATVASLKLFLVAKFWELLAELQTVQAIPDYLGPKCRPNHPFFGFCPESSSFKINIH